MEGGRTVAHTKSTFGRTLKCTHYGTQFLLGLRGTVLFLVRRAFEQKASTYFVSVCDYPSIILRSYRV
jgi:hypothetical protein